MLSILMLVVGIPLMLLLLFAHMLIGPRSGVASGSSYLVLVSVENIAQGVREGDWAILGGCWSNLNSVGFSNNGFLGFGDDGIPSLISREEVNVTVDNMGTVHTSFSQLRNVAGVGESWKMAIEDGGFIATTWVQGGPSGRQAG